MDIITVGVITDDAGYFARLAEKAALYGRGLTFERIGPGIAENDGADADPSCFDILIDVGAADGTQDRKEMMTVSCGERTAEFDRYGNVKHLCRGIKTLYCDARGYRPEKSAPDGVRMIAVASPSGGSGCTTTACALAQHAARFMGFKPLYINISGVNDTELYFRAAGASKRIDEYIYSLNNGRGMSVSDCLLEDGFGAFALRPAPRGGFPTEADAYTLGNVILEACADGGFDAVIVDMGPRADSAAMWVLANCRKTVLITGESDAARHKEATYLTRTGLCEASNVSRGREADGPVSEYIRVVNRGSKAFFSENVSYTGDAAENTVFIPEDESLFRGENGNAAIYLDGVFGAGIAEIAEKLLPFAANMVY